MDSITIEKILWKGKGKTLFKGWFPCDKLFPPNQFPSAIIVNEDPTNKPGSHWVCLYFKDKGEVYYFDSFGREPIIQIKKFINNFDKVSYNSRCFQTILSETCAHYCIFFIHSIANGSTINEIIKRLSNHPNSDHYVYKYVKCIS